MREPPFHEIDNCIARVGLRAPSDAEIRQRIRESGIRLVCLPHHGSTRLGEARRGILGRFDIVLYRSKADDAPFSVDERFTIVHELGHIVLERDYGIAPESDDAYWRSEEWCDTFAARLLVPDDAVPRAATPDPSSLVVWITTISGRCGAPWEAVARRIAEAYPETCFVLLREVAVVEHTSRTLPAFTFSVVSSAKWNTGSGRSLPLRPESSLASILKNSLRQDATSTQFSLPGLGQGVVRRCPSHSDAGGQYLVAMVLSAAKDESTLKMFQ